jgi:hypothetical protein
MSILRRSGAGAGRRREHVAIENDDLVEMR